MGDQYRQWITANVEGTGYGKCAEATEAMAAAFPELTRVRGALDTLRNPAPGVRLVSHGFVSRYCTWTEDDLGVSQTTCGNSFALDSGSPGENGMKFCCYCGKELRAPDLQKAEE